MYNHRPLFYVITRTLSDGPITVSIILKFVVHECEQPADEADSDVEPYRAAPWEHEVWVH